MHSNNRPTLNGYRKDIGRKKLVVTETLGKVFLIGINRPEKRNCVNFDTAQELVAAFEHFENNEDLSVAVLHGKGGYFSSGYDLAETAALKVDVESCHYKDNKDGKGGVGPSRIVFSKPTIAAVEGYAVAGGMELSLICDMRVMEQSAIMGIFNRRYGVPLIDGGTVRLPQLIGLSRALDVIMTGRPIAAKEAHEMGLANRVVQTGAAVGEAVKLAQSLCNFPQECLRRDRLSAYYSTFAARSIDDAFNFEWENAKHVIKQEAIPGAQRFVDGVGRGGSFDTPKNSKL